MKELHWFTQPGLHLVPTIVGFPLRPSILQYFFSFLKPLEAPTTQYSLSLCNLPPKYFFNKPFQGSPSVAPATGHTTNYCVPQNLRSHVHLTTLPSSLQQHLCWTLIQPPVVFTKLQKQQSLDYSSSTIFSSTVYWIHITTYRGLFTSWEWWTKNFQFITYNVFG